MVLKYIAPIFAVVTLSGCCASSNGCNAPLPGTPIAWDGLGSIPENGSGYRPKRKSLRTHEVVVGPLNATEVRTDSTSQSDAKWAREQAADRDADTKLTKQLVICRNC